MTWQPPFTFPRRPGWYPASATCDRTWRRYWNSVCWSAPVHADDPPHIWERNAAVPAEIETHDGMRWIEEHISAPIAVPGTVVELPPGESAPHEKPSANDPVARMFAAATGKQITGADVDLLLHLLALRDDYLKKAA